MKKTIILLFITTVIASGCKKFLDVNNNPNQPTVVTPNVVLSAALTGTAANIGTDFLSVNRYMGYWSRSGNYVSDPVNEDYEFENNQTDGEFTSIYTSLHRLVYIQNQGRATGQPFYQGVAQTLEPVLFSTLVDVYGDVPYTQAFNPDKYQQPKYDDAATIYTDLIAKLDSAVDSFTAAKTFYAGAPKTTISTDDQYDLMFGRGAGSAPAARMDKWIALANTIKLKLLLHEYKVATPAYITAEIAKITANGGGFIGPNESAAVNPGYSNVTNKQNPFYGLFQTPTAANNDAGYYRANTYAMNFYFATGDERENFFYGAPYTTGGTPAGSNYDGDPHSVTNATASQIGGDGDQSLFGVTLSNAGVLKSSSQDQLVLSDFESLFDQAEAAERGWITGDAKTFYTEAVEQNFVYLNANLFVGQGYIDPKYSTGPGPVGEADYYVLGNSNTHTDPNFGFGLLTGISDDSNVVFTGTDDDKLRVILTQKWAALNGINWVEAWTDYRRTGYPLSPILDISHSTVHVQNKIPTRYLYPQSELNTNGANVPKLASPAQYDLIFWDK